MNYFVNSSFQKTITSVILFSFLFTVVAPPAFAADPPPDYGKDCLADTGISALGDAIIGFLSGALNSALGTLTFGLFKGPDPVTDQTTHVIALKADLKNCLLYLQKQVFDTALSQFKKRLLDKMTDDVVKWIKDDGSGSNEPRFTKDFGGFLKDTLDESLGKTAEQLGFSNLCSQSLSVRLQLQLQQPSDFTEQVNCTLNDVLRNGRVGIASFARDFRAGGWIGYNEVLKPQNNRYGLEILAIDQAAKTQTEKQTAAQNELTAGGGYTPEKACYEWSRLVSMSDNSFEPQYLRPSGSTGPRPIPPWQPAYLDTHANFLIPTTLPLRAVRASSWDCTDSEVTIPPGTVGALTNHAITANDTQGLASADDLKPYISAIFDAAINRLFKEGVQGLRGALGSRTTNGLLSESATGRSPSPWTPGSLYAGYGSAFATSSDPSAQLKDAINATITSTTLRMLIASSSLLAASSSLFHLIASTTGDLILPLQSLTQCEIAKNSPDNVPCASTGVIATNNTAHATIIQTQLNSLKTLSTQLLQIKTAANDPNISVASLISLVAVVNNVYLSVENIINDLVPSFIFDINNIASSMVNPRLKACQSVAIYACPL